MNRNATKEVVITAPARIHCGLFSAGQSLPIEFGGCGFMVNAPPTILRVKESINNCFGNTPGERVANLVEKWNVALGRSQPFKAGDCARIVANVDVQLERQPPQHVGFGSGTQLAAAIAVGLSLLTDGEVPNLYDIAFRLDRGKRSAIGLNGFFYGGFLVDRGRSSQEQVSPLQTRLHIPEEWRCVLICLPDSVGISGSAEQQAFEKCLNGSQRHRSRAIDCVRSVVLPALANSCWREFGEGIYEFNRMSGELFRATQYGIYGHALAEDIVRFLRRWGITGVVQSSWGPTLAAIACDQEQAVLACRAIAQYFGHAVDVDVSEFNNQGANVEVWDDGRRICEWTMASVDRAHEPRDVPSETVARLALINERETPEAV